MAARPPRGARSPMPPSHAPLRPPRSRAARVSRTSRASRAWAAALEGVVPDRVLFSPWMRRLGRVSFLGALDQADGCLQRPSRLDHSAGVATLALSVGRSLKLDEASL